MDDILAGLNEEQKAAVTATEGFVRVIAGAGSGKTRALTRRFAYLVDEIGILPGNILCVTFTNKAANEMRQRIHALTGDDDTGYINTFHGFCVSVLQEDSHAVQYPKRFLVLDNADIDQMLQLIYEERGLTSRDMTFSKARDMIEIQKLFKKPDYYHDLIALSLQNLEEKYRTADTVQDIIFYGYLYQEKKCFGLDYNDLIKFTLYIFKEHDDIRLKWQERLEYIMIDEFQDIDMLQYELMCVLCDYHKNLFIVGDPDQTIYTWRGADVRYLLDFDRNFPGTKTIMMMKNYRSTPQILTAANSLIAKNEERMNKKLIPMLPPGKNVVCDHCPSPQEEGARLAREMLRLHGEEGVPFRQMTVLYRAHYLTRNLEDALLKADVPYTIYSGVPFFGRLEIKNALAYLRLIAFRDDLSCLRVLNVPKRNLGKRRVAFLQDYAAENGCSIYQALEANLDDGLFKGTKARAFVELIDEFSQTYREKPISRVLAEILDRSGYEAMLRTEGNQARLDNLAELKQAVFEYETTCGEEAGLEDYLNHIALFSNQDAGSSGDKVKLMTVHTAKGLEFPYVFLCGLNEGVFPSRKTRTRQAMEEERRLAFVAMTRAEKGLYLTEAEGMDFDGWLRYPSRFLLDIDPSLLEFREKAKDSLIEETREYIRKTDVKLGRNQRRQDLLQTGQRVHHRAFGDGTIKSVDMEKMAYLIQFDKMATPRQIAFKIKLTAI